MKKPTSCSCNVGETYCQATTTKLAEEGFRTCDIMPKDLIFFNINFLPSGVTDQCLAPEPEKSIKIDLNIQTETEITVQFSESAR